MNENQETLTLRQRAKWLPADLDTPISAYIRFVGNNDGILLESAEVDGRWGRYSLLAYNMLLYISCDRGRLKLDIRHEALSPLSRFSGLPFCKGLKKMMAAFEIEKEENFQDLPPITRALYGYFGFEMAAIFNPVLQKSIPPEDAKCYLALPGTVLLFDHLYNRLCSLDLDLPLTDLKNSSMPASSATGDDPSLPSQLAVESRPSPDGYKDYVRVIRRLLNQGEAIQVVPSTRFSVPFKGKPITLYRNMRRYNASPYMFYMHFPDLTLFGSSPEVMVRCTDDLLQLSPIAGTRRRGRTAEEDNYLAKELLEDPKERAEHIMLVDLGRNDLGRVAETGTVQVEKSMEIERFSHVMHLTSSILARLDRKKGNTAIDVLAATFPAGTVSGAPKIRAIEIIRGLEGMARGPYAGCIGWLGLDKNYVDMDMGITIRSMWVKDGVLHWQTGGGIVHDSDPDLEWKEVFNKSAIMRMAISPEDVSYVPVHR